MKQYGNFKLGVLLLASAGLASCSSDDTFSGSKGQSGEPVKTQFAISVPVGNFHHSPCCRWNRPDTHRPRLHTRQ